MEDTLMLPCELTDEELSTTGKELARLVLVHKRLEEEKKEAMKEWKERLDASSVVLLTLSRQVKSSKADRLVEIMERPAMKRKKGYVETVRLDTEKVVSTRAMTALERNEFDQGKLFSVKAGGKKAKARG